VRKYEEDLSQARVDVREISLQKSRNKPSVGQGKAFA
jgi:hypothetical protein